jgi:hypothetical protein
LFLHDKAARLPGEMIYRDADGRAESLLSDRYGLKGKPDYVLRSRGALLPVEVKSRACGSRGPYDSEKAQLFAYCLLVEDQWDTTARAGILQYRDRRMLLETLKAEVDDYLERHRSERDEQGHALVVRNGHAQTRKLTLGAGTVELSGPMTAGVMNMVIVSASPAISRRLHAPFAQARRGAADFIPRAVDW